MMTWARHFPFKYHTQDLGRYCGPAVASMILSANNPAPVILDQDQIWTLIQRNNLTTLPQTWATEPVGLAKTLTAMSFQLSSPQTYSVNKPTDFLQGTLHILNALHQQNSPAAALVYQSAHWIAVNGVQTDVEPVPDAPWRIQGFWVQVPVFHKPQNPPPHSTSDPCGTGNALGDDDQFWPYTDKEWIMKFRGCQYDDTQTKFISVTPSQGVPAPAIDSENPIVYSLLPVGPADASGQPDGLSLITPAEAIEFSKIGLRQYDLYRYKFVDEAISGAVPGKPLLVCELEELDGYYYLVPWEVNKAVVIYTKVDARYGDFRGLQILRQPLRNAVISKEQVLKLISGRRFEFSNIAGRVMVLPGTAAVLPTLVWRPCLESMSSYFPFYQVVTGTSTLYVRIDGEVFTMLTPVVNGGYINVMEGK